MNKFLMLVTLSACSLFAIESLAAYSKPATDDLQPKKDLITLAKEKWEQFKQSDTYQSAQQQLDKLRSDEKVKQSTGTTRPQKDLMTQAKEKWEQFKQSDTFKTGKEKLDALREDEKVRQSVEEAKAKAKAQGTTLVEKAKAFFGFGKKS